MASADAEHQIVTLFRPIIAALAPQWNKPDPRRSRPPKERIAAAHRWWVSLLPHVPLGHDTCTCWACGYHGDAIECAHLTMRAKGGSNHPRNFMLLCTTCHRCEQDDMAPVSEQVEAIFDSMLRARFRTPMNWRLADVAAGAPPWLEGR
jgi:hypothetical protein